MGSARLDPTPWKDGRALLELVKSFDRETFQHLRRFVTGVVRNKLTGFTEQDVEDTTALALARIYAAACGDRVRNNHAGSFMKFVAVVTAHVALSERERAARRRSRETRLDFLEEAQEVDPRTSGPERFAAVTAFRFLSEMDEPCRSTITSRAVDGLSFEQMASRFEDGLEAVKKRYYRCLKLLRHSFEAFLALEAKLREMRNDSATGCRANRNSGESLI